MMIVKIMVNKPWDFLFFVVVFLWPYSVAPEHVTGTRGLLFMCSMPFARGSTYAAEMVSFRVWVTEPMDWLLPMDWQCCYLADGLANADGLAIRIKVDPMFDNRFLCI